MTSPYGSQQYRPTMSPDARGYASPHSPSVPQSGAPVPPQYGNPGAGSTFENSAAGTAPFAHAPHNPYTPQAPQAPYAQQPPQAAQAPQATQPAHAPYPQQLAHAPQNSFAQQQYYQGYHNPQQPYGAPFQPSLPVGEHGMLNAALLAFFTGWVGGHNYYLGYTSRAAIQTGLGIISLIFVCVSLVFWPIVLIGLPLSMASSIWAIVELVFILTKSHGYDRDAAGYALKS